MVPFVIINPFMFDGQTRADGSETALMQHPDWGYEDLAEQIKLGNVKPAVSGVDWYDGPASDTFHRDGLLFDGAVFVTYIENSLPNISAATKKSVAKYLKSRGYAIPKQYSVQKPETVKKAGK